MLLFTYGLYTYNYHKMRSNVDEFTMDGTGTSAKDFQVKDALTSVGVWFKYLDGQTACVFVCKGQ